MINYIIECPVCKTKMELEPEYLTLVDSHEHRTECPECQNPMILITRVDYKFEAVKVPCSETGEHSWDFVVGLPKHEFYNMIHCAECDKSALVENLEDMEEYLGSKYFRWFKHYQELLLNDKEYRRIMDKSEPNFKLKEKE